MKKNKIIAAVSSVAILATMLTPFSAVYADNELAIAETTEFVVTADTPIAAGTVYTDDANLKVESVYAISKIGSASAVIDSKTFTHNLPIRLDTIDFGTATYTEKAGNTPLVITAKNNGDLTIYYRRQCSSSTASSFVPDDGKDMLLAAKSDSGYTVMPGAWTLSEETNAGQYAFGAKAYSLTAGTEYLLYARGTTGTLLGYSFVPADGETPGTDPDATNKPADTTPEPDVTKEPETSADPTTKPEPIEGEITVDFTTMAEVPVYGGENAQGFVSKSSAININARQVAPVENIKISANGAEVTEADGAYLYTKTNKDDGDDFNYGGLIYRVDTGAPGAYHIEVETTASGVRVAPTGMNAGNLTGTNNWDNAKEVPRTVSAKWSGNTWSYDFATGEEFIEIEVEPSALPTADKPQTVGIKSIKITPLAVNAKGDKPTIHILGDSTQKTYTFNETISSWGQTLGNYFDKDKVNVINYSMGGRAMKSNYNEGRFDEILIRGKQGDFVFLHSAHNDETISQNRFSRGSGSVKDDLTVNNASYNRWLNMYIAAIKARGMTPVLVTAMPRVNSSTGQFNESAVKPNGFNPDSPGNMRAKAASDSSVGLAELYSGAKAYLTSLDGKEVGYIYNSIEAGETPANNSANGASGDGTHYREAAAKQFCRIILQSIYDQSKADVDTYTDKAIMEELVSYMPESVSNAAQTGDWTAVFPEVASDVSAVGVIPGAEKQSVDNFYYRTSIEKALQLGLLAKDKDNKFMPTEVVTVGEFARGIEKAFGLEENSLTNYTKTYAELNGETPSEKPSEKPSENPDAPKYALRIESEYNADGSLKGVKFTENAEVKDETPADYTKVLYWDSMDKMTPVANVSSGSFSPALSTAADEVTVTVAQNEGGVVTVYNDSAFTTITVDVTAGVAANQVIADNDSFTFTAPSEVVPRSDKSGVFAGNSAITTNAFEIRNSGTKEVLYTAKADGVLTLYVMAAVNKVIECKDITTGNVAAKYINNLATPPEGSGNQYNEVTFDVTAGTTYQLYTRGGTGRLFGIKYESNDYPQSTESLAVNAGDTVRVVAAAKANYVNGAIIVDGAEVTTGKSYTFTAAADTTVSASFIKEPELVENTVAASDAALTREVMGAILYDAYQLADKTIMEQYMSQNGGVLTPDDPNYDPNLTYEGSPYIPTTGWGALTDKADLSNDLFAKVKAAYNLGLIRPETGIARGSLALGKELEPKVKVTRAKAAKALVFCFVLTQPLSDASQKVPAGFAPIEPTAIALPNADAPTVPIIK